MPCSLRSLVVVTVAVLSLASSQALAQEDPYGSTTTTTSAPAEATISLTVDSGPRGTRVGVFACGYAPTTASGSVTFDGQVVASGLVADADGCLTTADRAGRSATVAAHGRLRAQSGAPLTIQVPDDARPGRRNVCAVVAGYNTPCARFHVRNDADVRGVSIERGDDASAASRSASPFSGSLPRTGLAIVLLLVVAAVLFVVGRRLLHASARRSDGHIS